MPISYLCIDDEAAKVEPIVQTLREANLDLAVTVRTPIPFDEEIRQLGKTALDGLLLDLRLDRAADENGKRVYYRALSLAQELRTRMTEGAMPSYPIVLWSVDDNFKLSYDKDDTGHDLFDARYYKGTVPGEKRHIANELVDLANGYKIINSYRSKTVKSIYSKLIDLEDAFDVIDPRIASSIAENRSFPAHVFAQSVMRNLILGSGPLVDEAVLAARLGVDPEKSDDWLKLKEKFAEKAKYTGIFGAAWPRWWMYKINASWQSIHPAAPLQRLAADDRVQILKKALRLSKLTAALPIEDGYDKRFWYVCKLLHRPVSPINSIQLSIDRREWQDGIYASLKAVLERQHKAAGYEIHAFERPKMDAMMTELRDAKK